MKKLAALVLGVVFALGLIAPAQARDTNWPCSTCQHIHR